MLKITPKECHNDNFPNVTGICMISLECQQRSGLTIGACRDGHLFGACCHDPLASQLQQQHQGQQEVIKSTTEATTTTTTEADPSSFSASSSSQQENNEVIPIDSDAQLDSQTSIPSLIDTFSELSPTFLSELALDEHTTGMYASLPISDGSDIEDQHQSFMKQKIQDATSAANMISTEFLTTTDRNPRTSTSTVKFHGVEPTGGGEVFQDEVGSIDGLDLDFKDNMIKYIDEIVTMRNNELTAPPAPQPSPPETEQDTPEVPVVPVEPVVIPTESVEEPVPIPEAVRIRNELDDMPFSTYTIVSSTKPAEDGHEIHTIISTTGSGDKMLPSTTTPVPPSSEEIVGVTVARSIGSIPSSTESSENNEINEIKDVTESTTQEQASSTESVKPTKFTFSKLKYSPRPFKQRHTTEKVVWTRPPTSTPIPPWKNAKPVELEEDEEEDEEEEEEDDIRNNLISSSSTQAASIEETTVASSSTEGGVSSSTSYFADDNVEAHNYHGGVEQTTYTSDYPSYSSYFPSSYTPSQVSYYPQSSYSPPPSSYAPSQSSYSPPQSSYSPPQSSYSPPQSSYSPPVSSYSPPQQSYYAPQSSYSPSQSSYSPPQPLDTSSPSSYSSYYTDSSPHPYSSSSPAYIPEEETSSEPSTTAPSESYSSTTGFGFDWSSPTILSLLKATSENLEKYYYGSSNTSRNDLEDIPNTTENEIETSPSSISTSTTTGKSSSTTWKSTPQMSDGISSSHNTDASTAGGAVRTTGLFSTNPNPTASSSWDSSIDSFVDQVVEGIVHDLNKSNKIDDMIFNNQNKQAQGVSSTTVGTTKKLVNATSTTPAPAEKSSGKSSKHSASREKSKHKSRPNKTSTSTESPTPSTTSKERLKKVKTKVPAAVASTASKRRTNKNKVKPVKKVTTSSIKTANSTRKRLDYKKDCGVRPLIKRGRIVGGTPSQFGSWPWHALVKETVWWGIFSKIKCGGVLIGPQHVLTAGKQDNLARSYTKY